MVSLLLVHNAQVFLSKEISRNFMMLKVQVQNTLSMSCFRQDTQSICNSINFGIIAYFGALILELYIQNLVLV
jgi:hypothetical protein